MARTAKKRTATAGSAGIAALAFLFLSVSARAATWYVDSSVASSGNGTSWTTAWKQPSNMTGLVAGDTVYVSGGPSGSSQTYTLAGSFPTINGVTYKIGQDSSHNGTAKFSGSGTFLADSARNNVTISGDAGDGNMHFALSGYTLAWTQAGYAASKCKCLYINFGGMSGGYETFDFYNAGNIGNELGWIWVQGTGTSVAHIVWAGGYATGAIWDQFLYIHDSTFWCPNTANSGSGCDGIQTGQPCSGLTVSNCTFAGYANGNAADHQDGWQPVSGPQSYMKFVNNTWLNMVDAVYMTLGGAFNHIIIANNVVIKPGSWDAMAAIGGDVEGGASCTMSDFVVANNTVYGSAGYGCIAFYQSSGTITWNGVTIENNVVSTAPRLDGSGTSTTANNPVLSDASMAASFVYFSSYATNCDFHLKSSASSLIGKGTNLSIYFSVDKDGNTRALSGAWDIGAYAANAGNPGTNAVIQVSPSGWNFGAVMSGATVTNSFTVQNGGGGTLAGTASVATPFRVVSGGTYSLGSNQSQTVSVTYTPSGPNDSGVVTFTGGGGATTMVSGSLIAVQSGLSFPSYGGTITAPFVTNSSGYISQGTLTGVTDGGQAVYEFSITNAGNYTVSVNVNAPDTSANSVFVNIDAQPTDPTMIWDAPVTTGFTNQAVSWRGNGTDTAPQYVPEVFILSAGLHQLIIVGREANVQLGQITIAPYSGSRPAPPSSPQNLHIASTP